MDGVVLGDQVDGTGAGAIDGETRSFKCQSRISLLLHAFDAPAVDDGSDVVLELGLLAAAGS